MTDDRRLSLSEIDALCRKAARGAGYDWGMAEEAGRSARWLAAYGFQGPESLAAWLTTRDNDATRHHPALVNGLWQAPRSACPLTVGTIVSDRESQLLGGRGFEFSKVQHPLLMLSMVARIVENSEHMVVFTVGEHDIICAAHGMVCSQDFGWDKRVSDVSCHLAQSEPASADDTIEPSAKGRFVTSDALEILQRFAHLTYAPATEASRLAGAGSGLNDND